MKYKKTKSESGFFGTGAGDLPIFYSVLQSNQFQETRDPWEFSSFMESDLLLDHFNMNVGWIFKHHGWRTIFWLFTSHIQENNIWKLLEEDRGRVLHTAPHTSSTCERHWLSLFHEQQSMLKPWKPSLNCPWYELSCSPTPCCICLLKP